MISEFDIGWLVGLIEGDGCFTFDGKHATVALKITDLDTAQRFATLLRTTVCGPYRYEDSQIGPKPYYVAKIAGKRAREFMASTAHHFSLRRQEQISGLLGGQLGLEAMPPHCAANVPRQTPAFQFRYRVQHHEIRAVNAHDLTQHACLIWPRPKCSQRVRGRATRVRQPWHFVMTKKTQQAHLIQKRQKCKRTRPRPKTAIISEAATRAIGRREWTEGKEDT